MSKDVKIITVNYNASGTPDRKNIGRQLIMWLHQGYRLVSRDEIVGQRNTQNFTRLTFSKEE